MDAEALAKQLEMEAMADMFTKMTDSCHNKCISKFYDWSTTTTNYKLGQHYHMGEMDKAESVCADRCTSKFMEMHELIGKEITEFSMKNQAKMESAKN